MTGEEELRVLKMIQNGVISAAEGDKLLRALALASEGAPAEAPVEAPPAPRAPARPWTRYPLAAGSLLAALGAVILAADYAGGSAGLRGLGYVVLFVGVLVALAGLWLARAMWIRIHVSQPGGHSIHLALPVPLQLTAWAVRLASPHIRKFDATGLDEAILALGESARRGEALTVDVYESEDGERVQVSIG